MADPTKITQAQALFAVLAGAAQARRERVYYRDGVLRSSLYFIPHEDASEATAVIRENPLNDNEVLMDTSYATSDLTISFTSVRVDYHDADAMDATLDFNIAMTYVGIAYPVYEELEDSMTATLDFNIAMTYTEILYPVYTEDSESSMNATLDFNIAMRKV